MSSNSGWAGIRPNVLVTLCLESVDVRSGASLFGVIVTHFVTHLLPVRRTGLYAFLDLFVPKAVLRCWQVSLSGVFAGRATGLPVSAHLVAGRQKPTRLLTPR